MEIVFAFGYKWYEDLNNEELSTASRRITMQSFVSHLLTFEIIPNAILKSFVGT